ncbi:MAG: hypothetical protein DWG76_03685 [Chloroflexi bacterium]|nr:hypothetical protein [Chloroflexota bacterium]
MNDKFLYDARPKNRRGFAQALYAKLTDAEPQLTRWQAFIGNRAAVVTSALALLLLAAVAYQILSPRFHHEAQINGIDIYEMDYRIVLQPDWAAPLVEDAPEALSEPGESRGLISVYTAMDQLPYRIKLPTYFPEGMELF